MVNDRHLGLRIPTSTYAALSAHATFHGRTVGGEVRVALRYWLRVSDLAYLATPDGVAECKARGLDLEAEREQARTELAELSAMAFRPAPRMLGQRAPV